MKTDIYVVDNRVIGWWVRQVFPGESSIFEVLIDLVKLGKQALSMDKKQANAKTNEAILED